MTATTASRRGLVGAAITALALVTAACGGSDEEGSTTAEGGSCEPSGEEVELEFWSWVPGMTEAVDVWNQQNPDIQVAVKEVTAGNAGTYQNMFNALESGNAPDLGQVEYDSLASFRLQQGLTDIAACPGISDASADFVDWTWSQVSFGGEGAFAIPQDTGPMAMYYRADLFEEYGIEVPTTWEDYYVAAQTVQQENPDAVITHFPQGDANWFTGLLWQAGASLFETDGESFSVDIANDSATQVADYWQRMIDEDLVATNLQGFSPALYKAWSNGEVLTWISAAWGYGTIRDNAPSTEGDWAVAPMPQWEEGASAAGNWGGSTTAVFTDSDYPAEAAEFALWLNTDPEALEILNREGGLFPAADSGLELPALAEGVEFYGGQKVFDVFTEASANVDTDFTWGPIMTDTYRFMSDGFSAALGGEGTLGETLEEAQTKTVESLESQGITVSE